MHARYTQPSDAALMAAVVQSVPPCAADAP